MCARVCARVYVNMNDVLEHLYYCVHFCVRVCVHPRVVCVSVRVSLCVYASIYILCGLVSICACVFWCVCKRTTYPSQVCECLCIYVCSGARTALACQEVMRLEQQLRPPAGPSTSAQEGSGRTDRTYAIWLDRKSTRLNSSHL